MNSDIISHIVRDKWHKIRDQVVQQWDKITYDDLEEINASCEKLEEVLKKKYGYDKDQAQQEIDKFLVRNLWKDKDEDK